MRLSTLLLLAVTWFGAAPVVAETLLVVRKSGNAVDFVDPGSGLRLASVAVGHAPHEISVSPDGRRAAVTNYGTRERPGSTLSIVDLEQPRELLRIDLATHTRPHGVDWFAAERIAVTTEGSMHLLVVDPTSGHLVSEIETGQDTSHMVAVSADGRRAYVTSIGSGTTSALDLDAARKLGDVVTGAGSEALALTPDGGELWVAARGSGELVAIDVASRKLRDRRKVDVPLAPGAAARPLAGLAPGSALPVGLLVASDGRSAYVAATMADRVVRYELPTLDALRGIEVDGEPDGLASTPVLPKATCHACAQDAGDGPAS